METAIGITLGGLGFGGFFALLAVGLVIVFRGSGVINFAQGAIAMFVAYEFHSLRKKGTIQLPWIDLLPTAKWNLPVRLTINDTGLGLWPSFVLALLVALLLGLLAHFLVFRPLRNAAPLGRVVGSLGLMLYLQGVALRNFGPTNPQPEVVLPGGFYKNFLGLGRDLPQESFWLAALSIVFGGALWCFYRFTRIGLATRAAAGNEKGAVLLGYSPETLALSNWLISSFLTGLAGILVGSITGALNQVKFTGLLVPALGAALVGRLSSIPVATVAGIAIGLVRTLASVWLPTNSWFPLEWQGPATNAVPLLIIVFVLFVRGLSLPIRGTAEETRLPPSPHPTRVWQHALFWSVAALALAFLADRSGRFAVYQPLGLALTTTIIAAVIMLSYVVLTGYVGQISLAQMSIAGCAAFMTSRLLSDGGPSELLPFSVNGPGLPWPLAALLGVIFAVVVGMLIGLPALRVRGIQLAVVTLAAAVSMQGIYFENQKLTGVPAGSLVEFRSPSILGINFGVVGQSGLSNNFEFAVFCVLVLVVVAVAVANIRRSGTGRRFLAVRSNERAAAAAGVSILRTKMLAFAIASAIAGIGGVLTGYQARQVSSANWVFFIGLTVLAFAYLGGVTSINGAIVGGMLFPNGVVTIWANTHLDGAIDAELTYILGGLALIVTAILNPMGIAPKFQPTVQRFGRFVRRAGFRDWTDAVRRVAPGAVLAGLPVSLLLWAKAEEWRNWFLLLVPVLSLVVRSIVAKLAGSRLLVSRTHRVPVNAVHAND
jgi:branched-chain amino acid transport system permease protein